ncbi:hypothetical protein D9M71_377500 [compost metagenome]
MVQALPRGQAVEQRQSRPQHGPQAQLLGPGTAPRAQHGVQQRQRPEQEETVDLPVGTALQANRQQAVGPEERRHADQQAAHAGDVQHLDQAQLERLGAALGMLELALAQPHDQASADHRRAGQAEEEVQPAQPGAGENAHVQAVHAAGNQHRRRFGSAVVLQRAVDTIEHPASATLIGNAITTMPGEAHTGILITRVLYFDPAVATTRRLFLERPV